MKLADVDLLLRVVWHDFLADWELCRGGGGGGGGGGGWGLDGLHHVRLAFILGLLDWLVFLNDFGDLSSSGGGLEG